jgi:hypothetical protein
VTRNLNVQPLKYDWGRVRYSPEDVYDCSHCQTPLAPFESALVLPGNFHHPGRTALLCQRCAILFWRAEIENEQAATEAGY